MINYILTFAIGFIIGNIVKQFVFITFKKEETHTVVRTNPEELASFLDPEIREYYDNYFGKLEV